MEYIFQNINKQMMETTYTPKLGQLLKMALDFKKYIWQKLKREKPNITSKMISKPNVATMVETHFEIDTAAIELDNQMVVIKIQVGKNIVEDVLIDGGINVNIIIENFITKSGLPKPRPFPYHLRMVDQNMTKPLGIIKILRIHIHGIPYVTTFIVLKNSVVDFNYSMLLGRPWLRDAKVTHD
jgi:hypothetical protein